MEKVNFLEIEKKWQKRWETEKVFEAGEEKNKPKYYCLEMFPYPSGSGLHMGHAWNYTIGDIIARFKKLKGFNVLHPMGYDSLGLPAENAAIIAKVHPEDYTKESIKNFTRQMKEIGLSYDWSRVLSTSDSTYYKWDQWIFLKMFEKGLVYQKEAPVNWCPKCNTILANEQVQEGVCWRHDDTKVEIKQMKQWFLKITDYADELYEEIDKLDWPERTKAMQKNWIGKSHGVEIEFEVKDKKWKVFTTRPDTLFGVTFLVVSAQHKDLDSLVTKEQKEKVSNFLKKQKSVSEKDLATLEKEGIFTGSYAIHPITKDKIPVYAGNFVVADYGSGMVMSVPAHDARDYQFAKKYGIEIKQVISGGDISKEAHVSSGKLINSKEFDGLESEKAKIEITNFLIKKKVGKNVTNFRLRDWSVARQRYWGTPIPIVHCKKCGVVLVPEKDLPVKLPRDVKFGKGNPLDTNDSWLKVKCPKCKGSAKREPNTMDTFVNSSWYFLRYLDPKNEKEIFNKEKADYWCPVDTYIGGAEHACMHLIYFRFYTKFLADLGLIKFREPVRKLFHQGTLAGEGGVKMSKSKPETCVLPEDVSKEYGMDTARFFLSSLASPDKNIEWSANGIVGSLRFINKVLEFGFNFKEKKDSDKLLIKLNQTIERVSEYYETFQYRKATIEIREVFTLIEEGCTKETFEKFLKILNPICPHITEEINEKRGNKNSLANSIWPEIDKKKIISKKEEINVNERIVNEIKLVLERTSVKPKKAFVYVMPFEIKGVNLKLVTKEFDFEIEIFAVNDSKKFDPENKARKALPGKPSIYFE